MVYGAEWPAVVGKEGMQRRRALREVHQEGGSIWC